MRMTRSAFTTHGRFANNTEKPAPCRCTRCVSSRVSSRQEYAWDSVYTPLSNTLAEENRSRTRSGCRSSVAADRGGHRGKHVNAMPSYARPCHHAIPYSVRFPAYWQAIRGFVRRFSRHHAEEYLDTRWYFRHKNPHGKIEKCLTAQSSVPAKC